MGEANFYYFTCLKFFLKFARERNTCKMSLLQLSKQLSALTLRSPQFLKLNSELSLKTKKTLLSYQTVTSAHGALLTRACSSQSDKPMTAKQQWEEAKKLYDERDINEMKRIAEIREKAVKEHQGKVAASRFNFGIEHLILWTMVGFVVIDYFGLDFWDREDRSKSA